MNCRGVDMFDCVMRTHNARNANFFPRNETVSMRNAKYKDDLFRLIKIVIVTLAGIILELILDIFLLLEILSF